MRYGEIFHKTKASEMSHSISHKTSVKSDLFYTEWKCTHNTTGSVSSTG